LAVAPPKERVVVWKHRKEKALVVTSTQIDLEVNAEKNKYMVISRDQKVGKNQNIKINNKSFERVEELKYL
jgi:hypothetical protein